MIIDVIDRVPVNAGRVKLTPVEGNLYDMERADSPTISGTPINRDLFMQLQGFVAGHTVFNSDGSITETGSTGTKVTVFGDSGVTETFTGTSGMKIVKTTTFNSDGSITTAIS